MPTFRVAEALAATPRSHILRLDVQGQAFHFRAGQAAYLKPEQADKRRPYSIASAPEETARSGVIEFLVQTSGDGASGLTPELIRPGTSVAVDGPLGNFVFPDHPAEQRFAFIAGGTGIAPLRSMLRHALVAVPQAHIGLVYSVRSPDEFAYMQEFQQLEDEGRIDFRHTVTRSASGTWMGRLGRIDQACFDGLVVAGVTLCFVCGPPSLVGDIAPQLKQLGVGEEQIRIEQWAS